ncbi:MAG: flagellar biosynthetic protein FliR [Novosphingobium sp.]
MAADDLQAWVASCVLLSLRIAPVFLFAPPFTLVRAPRLFVALMGLGLSAALVSALPAEARLSEVTAATLAAGALRELFLGLVPVAVLQFLFGTLNVAGRTIDVQAGFGLAMQIDPTTRTQQPLVGTIFGYAAAATFFAAGGHLQLLRFFTASLRAVPLGAEHGHGALQPLLGYVSAVSLAAIGVGGAAIAALFLCDIVVAALSRTVPQMNALLLGIQVKAGVMLVAVPVALGLSGSLLARLVAAALEIMPRLL